MNPSAAITEKTLLRPSKGRGAGGREGGGGQRTAPLTPLPTKAEPTFVKIVNVQRPVSIEVGRFALLRLETDAPDDYLSRHVHARLTHVCEPEHQVAFHSRSDFHGGRGRVVVRAAELAKVGVEGTLTIFLLTPDERQLSSKIAFRIAKPKEAETAGKTARGQVDVPEPIAVYRDEWGTHGWSEKSVAEVKEDKTDTNIFVNMDNLHITRLLKGGNYQETGITRMKNNYLLYTAFYAWVQHVWGRQTKVDVAERALDLYQEAELDRVAQLVVHSISAAGRMDDED